METIFKNVNLKKTQIIAAIIILIAGVGLGRLMTGSHKPVHEPASVQSSEHQHEQNTVWTCAMHPQIRQTEPGNCPLCGMALIPLSSKQSPASSNAMVHEMPPEAIALANIQTSRVTGISSGGEVHLTGKLKADERLLASITAKFPGRIEELFVNFTGQFVKSGEKLATVYSPELLTAQRELLEALNSKDIFPELYASAREKLKLWKLTESQIDEIEKSGKVRDKFEILADKSGVVTRRNVSVGDYTGTGALLFDIADLSLVWVMIDAYETDLPFIKAGNEVTFTVAAIPGKSFTAKVTYIDPVINPYTRTVAVRAEMPNRNLELKPEMFVNARIRTSLHKGSFVPAIPRTSLLWSGKRSIVYVKVPNAEFPTFEMREITIGPRMGEMYLVEGGLEAGEEIVTNGAFAIDAAAQLSGNYSMLMRPKAKTVETPQQFREQITTVANAYFEVKNALVNDDPETTQKAAGKVTVALGNVDMGLLEGDTHHHWMALQKQLEEASEMISGTGDLEKQREHFNMLSEAILETTESFGLKIEKVYRLFCPMAFDDKGAYWLSESDEILNPYFGEMMLRCGEVKETYRKGQMVFVKESAVQHAIGEHNH